MSWYSVREYARRAGITPMMVERKLQEGELLSRMIGGEWYIQVNDALAVAPEPSFREATTDVARSARDDSGLQGVIDFSSKALHHYLLMSDKLLAEKDLRLQEREAQLSEKKQAVAELESYVQLLEEEIRRQRDKPEGWR